MFRKTIYSKPPHQHAAADWCGGKFNLAKTKGVLDMKTLRSFWNALTSIGAPDIRRADANTSTTQTVSPPPPPPAPEPFSARLEKADTLAKCVRLYQNAAPNSSEEERVAAKMQKMAVSFDDWNLIANAIPTDSPLGKRALERLASLAVNFEQWDALYELASADAELAPLKLRCLVGMRNLAQTIADWRKVYELSDPSSGERSLALQKLCELAAAENAWEEVTENLPNGDPLHAKALEERLKGAVSLGELESLYDDLEEGHALTPALLEKLQTCTEPIDDWIDTYSNRSSLDVFSETLLEKAISLATTPSNFITLMEAAENAHDDDAEKVLIALRRVSWTKEQWEELRDGASGGDTLENEAFVQLLLLRQTAPEILEFYLEYVENWDTDDDVVEKMLERLFSVATPEEAKIISILATEDDDLRGAADARTSQQSSPS